MIYSILLSSSGVFLITSVVLYKKYNYFISTASFLSQLQSHIQLYVALNVTMNAFLFSN